MQASFLVSLPTVSIEIRQRNKLIKWKIAAQNDSGEIKLFEPVLQWRRKAALAGKKFSENEVTCSAVDRDDRRSCYVTNASLEISTT